MASNGVMRLFVMATSVVIIIISVVLLLIVFAVMLLLILLLLRLLVLLIYGRCLIVFTQLQLTWVVCLLNILL